MPRTCTASYHCCDTCRKCTLDFAPWLIQLPFDWSSFTWSIVCSEYCLWTSKEWPREYLQNLLSKDCAHIVSTYLQTRQTEKMNYTFIEEIKWSKLVGSYKKKPHIYKL